MSAEAPGSMAHRLRNTLTAARADSRIRERLAEIVSDPSRMDAIVRELGPRHALVRELLLLARHEGHDDVEPPTAVAS